MDARRARIVVDPILGGRTGTIQFDDPAFRTRLPRRKFHLIDDLP